MQLIDKLIAMKNLQNKFTGIGLTYDDVLLVPAYSEILPNQVNLKTKFSKIAGASNISSSLRKIQKNLNSSL